ncbi:beta-lactamase [Kouleothrix aurantiaca]|jgi:phosphoribosyl 1,2-cyclic phosphodiesterase|uniref:Beta-lactamase n=1 Tax=Kouleothrix aurantiaca TaxID=186479 RepID=A0A0N8PT59_9CHLR|nr:beta-lactamase [Kouleothrix aurantiaca]
MPDDNLIIRFWGVRGSYPVPGPRTVRIGGNTACVEIQAGQHTLILDAGTGIINLGAELMRRSRAMGSPVTATILFSHMHNDHTQGFPFFDPAYVGASTLHILGPKVFESDLEETLSHAMLPPSFPVALEDLPSLKILRNVNETDIVLIGPRPADVQVLNIYHNEIDPSPDLVRVRTYHSYAHPKSGVNVYSISWRGKTVVYATDTEGYVQSDQRLVKFAKDADVLIHDAQYRIEDYTNPSKPKQGWGHSTPEMAMAVAQASNAKQLVLFHHEPTYADDTITAIEENARKTFPNTSAAYEGLEIVI